MLHARSDYQKRIQDSEGLIGEDEPVFLLRAKDVFAPAVLVRYADLLKIGNADRTMIESTLYWERKMREWQRIHGCKLPDIPVEAQVKTDVA